MTTKNQSLLNSEIYCIQPVGTKESTRELKSNKATSTTFKTLSLRPTKSIKKNDSFRLSKKVR